MKEFIRNLVRESLGGLISEKGKTPEKDGEKEDKEEKSGETDKPLDKKDQAEIQSVFNKPLAPSMADAWRAAGLGNANDDAGIRSMARKKIKQEDGQGLTDVEKDALTKTLKDKL
tara:strand:+ start:1961 stop:2305 length:345 start_codon:yes stop_codon:yes gene_type:complete